MAKTQAGKKIVGDASPVWTPERIRRFWGRCGFSYRMTSQLPWRNYRADPNGVEVERLPDVTDLYALFKWAMPVYAMKTGKDFMTIPTTLSPEKLAIVIAEAIEKALEEPKCPK